MGTRAVVEMGAPAIADRQLQRGNPRGMLAPQAVVLVDNRASAFAISGISKNGHARNREDELPDR